MHNDMNDQFDETPIDGGATGAGAGGAQGAGTGGTKERVKARARRMASQAQEQVGEQVREGVDSGRRRAAGTLDNVASSLLNSAEQTDGVAARYMERAGSQVQRLADYLENTDVTQLMAQTEGFARRQPLLFLGGAFLVGFAAARFLKSSRRAQVEDEYEETFGSMSDRERPLPGFREDDYGATSQGMHGDTLMGNEAMPGGTRGSATGSPGFGTPASTGMSGMSGSVGGTTGGTGTTGTTGGSTGGVGNTPGGNPISAAGRDFTDVDPTGDVNTLHGGAEGKPKGGIRGTGSSSESDRY